MIIGYGEMTVELLRDDKVLSGTCFKVPITDDGFNQVMDVSPRITSRSRLSTARLMLSKIAAS